MNLSNESFFDDQIMVLDPAGDLLDEGPVEVLPVFLGKLGVIAVVFQFHPCIEIERARNIIQVMVERCKARFLYDSHAEVYHTWLLSRHDKEVVLFLEIGVGNPDLMQLFDHLQQRFKEEVRIRDAGIPYRNTVDVFQNQIPTVEQAVATRYTLNSRQSRVGPVLIAKHPQADEPAQPPSHGRLDDQAPISVFVKINAALITSVENVRVGFLMGPDPLEKFGFRKVWNLRQHWLKTA
jgi:hypothetical protein